ncbi:hypothetical protein BpHYR1_044347 [Brachionus plicatilis]|uniref:Uncharacterized protein n=1 Tax=Brachionus plicatilis TaxID=10195 RepID=A0A3M7QQM5_BRAPC|nr:hypothetical protein BpHYR1_044347 [Brachionus plicatilis]
MNFAESVIQQPPNFCCSYYFIIFDFNSFFTFYHPRGIFTFLREKIYGIFLISSHFHSLKSKTFKKENFKALINIIIEHKNDRNSAKKKYFIYFLNNGTYFVIHYYAQNSEENQKHYVDYDNIDIYKK